MQVIELGSENTVLMPVKSMCARRDKMRSNIPYLLALKDK
jgi:hypothetical protein